MANKTVDLIFQLLASDCLPDRAREFSSESTLLGDGGLADSMKLVELCLALEDKADALGFQFDWTSDKAMSEHAGMFRTVQSLADEFDRQMHLAGKAN